MTEKWYLIGIPGDPDIVYGLVTDEQSGAAEWQSFLGINGGALIGFTDRRELEMLQAVTAKLRRPAWKIEIWTQEQVDKLLVEILVATGQSSFIVRS